jgi:hypothetical protein
MHKQDETTQITQSMETYLNLQNIFHCLFSYGFIIVLFLIFLVVRVLLCCVGKFGMSSSYMGHEADS